MPNLVESLTDLDELVQSDPFQDLNQDWMNEDLPELREYSPKRFQPEELQRAFSVRDVSPLRPPQRRLRRQRNLTRQPTSANDNVIEPNPVRESNSFEDFTAICWLILVLLGTQLRGWLQDSLILLGLFPRDQQQNTSSSMIPFASDSNHSNCDFSDDSSSNEDGSSRPPSVLNIRTECSPHEQIKAQLPFDTDDLSSFQPFELQMDPPEELAALKEFLMANAAPVNPEELFAVPLSFPSVRPHFYGALQTSDVNVKVLIDSGSRFSLISSDLLDEIRQKSKQAMPLQPTSINLVSHSRHLLTIIGLTFITLLLINQEGQILTIPNVQFLVTTGNGDVRRTLLGSEFLLQHCCQIHFNKTPKLLFKRGREVIMDHEITPMPDALVLTADYSFEPQESKLVDLKLINGTEQTKGPISNAACELKTDLLNLDTVVLTAFSENKCTRVMIKNNNPFSVFAQEGLMIGTKLKPETFTQCDATTTLRAIASNIPEKTLNTCFCQDQSGVIALFTSDGISDFLDEHMLNFEGNVMTMGPLYYEASTNRLFINRNCNLKDLQTSKTLDSMMPDTQIHIAIKGTHVSLREMSILTELQEHVQARNIKIHLVKFDIKECRKHADWHVYSAPRVWFHFEFSNNVTSAPPEHQPLAKPAQESFHEQVKLKFMNSEVLMELSECGELAKITCLINPINQFKEKLLQTIVHQLLRYYLQLTGAQADLVLSSSPSPTSRGLHRGLDTAPVNSIGRISIETFVGTNKLNPNHYLFFSNQLQPVQTITTDLDLTTLDPLTQLDWVEQILAAGENPDQEAVQQLPFFPEMRHLKNWDKETNQDALQRELDTLPVETRQLEDDKSKIPIEAFDDKSEISAVSNWTQTPSLSAMPKEINEVEEQQRIEAFLTTLTEKLPETEVEFYTNLVREFQQIFYRTDRCLPSVPDMELDLHTGDAQPVFSKGYPINARLLPGLQEMLDNLVAAGLIKPVTNERPEWVSSAFIIRRGASTQLPGQPVDPTVNFSKNFRLCVDFRHLNRALKKGQCLMPSLDEILEAVVDKTIMSTYDASSFFHALKLTPSAQLKCAFIINHQIFYPSRLVEGVSEGPRLASHLSRRLCENIERPTTSAAAYVDDFLLAATTLNDLRTATRQFFTNCRNLSIRLNIDKSTFCSRTVKFLGHVITYDPERGLYFQPLENRFKLFQNIDPPHDSKSLYRFIGLCGFVQRFVAGYDTLLSPLYATLALRLRNNDTGPLILDDTTLKAFKLICVRLANIKPIAVPSSKLDLMLICDSSYFGAGSILLCKTHGKYRVAGFFSRRYPMATVRATNSCSKELLALLTSLRKFDWVIRGCRSLTVAIDCQTLYALVVKSNSQADGSKASRWLARLHEYEPITYIHHVKRNYLQAADTLSKWFPLEEFPSEIFETHNHFLAYSFSKMRRDNIKMDIEPGTKVTLHDIMKQCEGDPTILKLEALDPDKNPPSETRSEYQQCDKCELSKTPQPRNPLLGTPAVAENNLHPAPPESVHQLQATVEANHLMGRYTSAYFISKQAEDPFCRQVIEQIQTIDPTPKHLSRFHLLHGTLLTRRRDKRLPPHAQNLQIYLPEVTLVRITASLHQLTHASQTNLKKMIRRFYYHPKIDHVCANIALSCPTCLHARLVTRSELPAGQLAFANEPSAMFFMDFLSLKASRHNNRTYRYCLNLVCAYSGFILTYATEDMLTSTVINILKTLLTYTGRTSILISDNQTSLLTSQELRQFLQQLNVSGRCCIPYAHKSNLTESYNRTIRMYLRIFAHAYRQPWIKVLDRATLAMNLVPGNGPHRSKSSPFELFHKGPSRIADPLSHLKNLEHDQDQLAKALNETRMNRQQLHQERTQAIEQQSKIRPGAEVVVLDMRRTDKQSPYYLPPTFEVISRKGYYLVVKNTETDQLVRTHISRCKLKYSLSPSIAGALRPEQREKFNFQDINLDMERDATVIRNSSNSEASSSSDSDDNSSERTPTPVPPRTRTPSKDQQSQDKSRPQTTNVPGKGGSANSGITPPPRLPTSHPPAANLPQPPNRTPSSIIKRARHWIQAKVRSIQPEPAVTPRRSARIAKMHGSDDKTPIPKTVPDVPVVPRPDPVDPGPDPGPDPVQPGPIQVQPDPIAPPPIRQRKKHEKRFRVPPDQVRRSARLQAQAQRHP